MSKRQGLGSMLAGINPSQTLNGWTLILHVNTHTHTHMHKWVGVEFCLLNTVFAKGGHWYNMEQIISQTKIHRNENIFFHLKKTI